MEQLSSRVRPDASVEDGYDNVRTRCNRVYVAEK